MTTSPELATGPRNGRTPESGNSDPLRILDELALLDDVRPVRAGHCYRCGFAPCVDVDSLAAVCLRQTQPITMERWLSRAAGVLMTGVIGVDHPFRQELLRAIGEDLALWPN